MTVPDPMDSAVAFVRAAETVPAGATASDGVEVDQVVADAGQLDVPAARSERHDAALVDGQAASEGDGENDAQTNGDAVSHVDDTTSPTADFRMAIVASVTLDLPSQHPQVCLRELESPRRQLTFSVGMPDAVALAHAQRRIATPRPLTHELMGEVLQRFDIDIVAVRIVGRVGAVHFAELDLRGRSGRSVHSCRPTDALILALHQPVQVPILIDARLLEGGGDVAPPGSS